MKGFYILAFEKALLQTRYAVCSQEEPHLPLFMACQIEF